MRTMLIRNTAAFVLASALIGGAPAHAAQTPRLAEGSIRVALAFSEPLPPQWIVASAASTASREQPHSIASAAIGLTMEKMHLADLVRNFDRAEAGRWVTAAVADVATWMHDPWQLLSEEGGKAKIPDPLVSLKTVSLDVSGLKKWSALEGRYVTQAKTKAWTKLVAKARQTAGDDLLQGVNAMANKVKYVNDPKDRWQAPVDFFRHGGDCEDYAIAKYLLLRALGEQADDMRIVMLGPTAKAVAHAVLVVATADGPVVLDNLHKHTYALNQEVLTRTVYAFSDAGWWVSVGPAATMVASK